MGSKPVGARRRRQPLGLGAGRALGDPQLGRAAPGQVVAHHEDRVVLELRQDRQEPLVDGVGVGIEVHHGDAAAKGGPVAHDHPVDGGRGAEQLPHALQAVERPLGVGAEHADAVGAHDQEVALGPLDRGCPRRKGEVGRRARARDADPDRPGAGVRARRLDARSQAVARSHVALELGCHRAQGGGVGLEHDHAAGVQGETAGEGRRLFRGRHDGAADGGDRVAHLGDRPRGGAGDRRDGVRRAAVLGGGRERERQRGEHGSQQEPTRERA